MGHLYLILGLGVLLLLAFPVSLYKTFARRYRLPYVAEPTLFSPAQLAFLAPLERALGKDYRVFARVRAADIVAPRRRLDRRNRRRAWDRLDGYRFDFLVCRARTGVIVCAVNLVRRSRLRRAPPRDALDRICAAARLPFLRFREADFYDEAQIAGRVFAAIQSVHKPVEVSAPTLDAPVEFADEPEDLGEAIVADDRRAEPGRSGPTGAPPGAPGPARPVLAKRAAAKPAPVAVPVEPPRREPTIAGTGDIDLGPSFRIDGDLDEDEASARRVRL